MRGAGIGPRSMNSKLVVNEELGNRRFLEQRTGLTKHISSNLFEDFGRVSNGRNSPHVTACASFLQRGSLAENASG